MEKILVTGAAGFIGYHTSLHLLNHGITVIGIDNLNDYYDVNLKKARLENLKQFPNFTFLKMDLIKSQETLALFEANIFTTVIHLAAQAGVRYSLTNPHAYIDSNIIGFLNILEGCRHYHLPHLIFASSSSVYGSNTIMPFSTNHNVDHPVSLYAATKKSNELMAHSYAHLYGLPVTGLRFFTVYGPWGRPDMALFLFTKAILENKPIDLFNEGHMMRDFTYIDDIVKGIVKLLDKPASPDPDWSGDAPKVNTSAAPYKIFNIGNNDPVNLDAFIACIESELNKKAIKNLLPIQAGDVPASWADVEDLKSYVNFSPKTPIKKGIKKFIAWYLSYYHNKTSLKTTCMT